MPLSDLHIIKKGGLLNDSEYRYFLECINKKNFLSQDIIPELKQSEPLKHLFLISKTQMQTEHDRNTFSKLIRSIRQTLEGESGTLPVYRWDASKKRYAVIYKPKEWKDTTAKKFILSSINSLSHRPELKKKLEGILNELLYG